MELWLVDINRHLVKAWEKEFLGIPDVHILCADIIGIAENTIVSPANGFGLMDGGIDQIYTEYFGDTPQKAIQKIIASRPEGFLPVGTAILVETGNNRIPYLISAPTMLLPEEVSPVNVYFAFKAVLKIAELCCDRVNKVYCPGLATGIGRVSPEDAASEMANCYKKWINRNQIK